MNGIMITGTLVRPEKPRRFNDCCGDNNGIEVERDAWLIRPI